MTHATRKQVDRLRLQRYLIAGIAFVLGLLIGMLASAAEPVATASEATGWALADIATLSETDRPFQRYVWIPPWSTEDAAAAVDFVVNSSASRSRSLHAGRRIANGWMLAYDLRLLAPAPDDFTEIRSVWDGLAIDDPYFHVPKENSGVRASVLGPHLEQTQAVATAALTLSTGAIYRADWLTVRLSSQINGGVYYRMRGIEKFRGSGGGQASYLASRGVFNTTAEKLSADQRAAMFFSNVTGKPRLIEAVPVLVRGGGVAGITHDAADEDIRDPAFHPIRNLLTGGKDRAREILVPLANGLIEYTLFDSNGELQDEVPPNIAHDSTIPPPYSQRLEPMASCVRCHSRDAGWLHFDNDVLKLIGSDLDIFSDIGDLKLTREQVVDRLAGLYAGDLDGPDSQMGRARRDYTSAVFRLTGLSAQEVGEEFGDIYRRYAYTRITPQMACEELGVQLRAGDDPKETIARLLPIQPGSPVDPAIGFLRMGVPINRADWEHVFVDASLLASRNRLELTGEQ